MASSDSSTDSRDTIPLSQIMSPVAAAARAKHNLAALRDVMHPPDDKFDSNSNRSSDSAEEEYHPRLAQRSRDRGDVVDSFDESDSSSDGDKKQRAQPKTKSKSASSIKKEKCQGKACPGIPPSEHHPMIDCALDICTKRVHRICYEKQLSKSSVARTPIGELVFCNLRHHNKFVKSHSEMELTWTPMMGRMALTTQRLPSSTSWNGCPAK
jgi:hypothetical protein